MNAIDLTPFGFTPTESLAYSALLNRGPSSGYALAQVIGVARANAYQALRSLVAKGAAVVAEREPQVFRAVQPDSVLALIAASQQEKLERLEQQMVSASSAGAPATVEFTGERELFALALRTLARLPTPVVCVAAADILIALLPIWRKRASDGAQDALWAIGRPPEQFTAGLTGVVTDDRVIRFFGSRASVVSAETCAALALEQEGDLSGIWSSDPILIGAARATVASVTAQES